MEKAWALKHPGFFFMGRSGVGVRASTLPLQRHGACRGVDFELVLADVVAAIGDGLQCLRQCGFQGLLCGRAGFERAARRREAQAALADFVAAEDAVAACGGGVGVRAGVEFQHGVLGGIHGLARDAGDLPAACEGGGGVGARLWLGFGGGGGAGHQGQAGAQQGGGAEDGRHERAPFMGADARATGGS